MYKAERHATLIDIIKDQKYVTVEYLAKRMFTSTSTIRRDLDVLEMQGIIKRSYGCAVLSDFLSGVTPIEYREHAQEKEKMIICEKASKLIQNGDIIFLDSSSTVLLMIEFLKEFENLTVITNSAKAITLLSEHNIDVYCIGGKLIKNSLAFAGGFSEAMIENLNATKLFFSSKGLSLDGQITGYSEQETRLRSLMLKHSKQNIFLCDSSKIGKTFMFKVCDINNIDVIVSDTPLPKELVDITSEKVKLL